MKQVIIGCMLCLGMFQAIAQQTIFISTSKTTSLVFPNAISFIDRGTSDVLVQRPKEAENILLVKAGKRNFSETNLSVVTSDGKLHSFKVVYDSMPKVWVYHYDKTDTIGIFSHPDIIHSEELSAPAITSYARGILDNTRKIHGLKEDRREMELRVNGIYIKGNVLFFHLAIENNSMIDYDVELMRMYIRDQRRGKRTATQERELNTLQVTGNTHIVKARNKNAIVVAVQKFTIPDGKDFVIEIMERNGGRHLSLRVKNRRIIRAETLPDLR